MFKRLLGSSRFAVYLAGMVSTTVAIAMGWDEARADELTRLLVIVYTVLSGVLMGGTALEDLGKNLGAALAAAIKMFSGEDPKPKVERTSGPVPEGGKPPASISRPEGFTRGAPNVLTLLVLCGALLFAGPACTGTATTSLSAGDALDRVADELALAVNEYHEELMVTSDTKDAAIASAFILRVQQDAQNAAALAVHQKQFLAALQKLRRDREVAWTRRNNTMDNVGAVREVSKGLRRLALDSLSLNDEMRRYLSSWYDMQQQAKTREAEQNQIRAQQRSERKQGWVDLGVQIGHDLLGPVPAGG